MRFNIRSIKGFTLVEALITVAIMAILVGLATPGYQSWMAKSRADRAANSIIASLRLARSEAAKRNTDVIIVPQSQTDWSKGWAVSMNNTSYSNCQSGSSNCFLIQEPIKNVEFTNTPNSVTYDNGGRVVGGANVNFNVCDSRKEFYNQYQVSVIASGRARINIEEGACAP